MSFRLIQKPIAPSTYDWLMRPTAILSCCGLIILSYLYIDQPLAVFIKAHEMPQLTSSAKFISRFGEAGIYLFLFGFLFLFYRYKLKSIRIANKWLYLLTSVVISGLICDLLKYILGRARPVEFFQQHVYGFHFFYDHNIYLWGPHITSWLSFPSGHSTTAAAVAVGVNLLWQRYTKYSLSLMLLVALSRVLLTRHYLSDVIAGLYLGALISVILSQYFFKKVLDSKQ